ncbi:MAG TPA: LysR family transcriptional regulator [Pseudoxanthomonas sp.]|jgi:DNA-binding transcriptional LysR family regulator|nr:LysR family transcriptional regulator [Pseudoxanthomonas sp.]
MVGNLPPLNALRAFEAVARLGNLGAAGRELHVTHGAVSRQLRLLEDDLGVALFLREGRGLVLTDAGRQLQEAAQAAFLRLRDTAATLRRGPTASALVLGCPASILARWMIPRLDRLARDLPDLTLHLAAQERDFDAALTGLDAALLVAEPPPPREWQVHALAGERIGPVLSPRYAGYAALVHAPAERLREEALLHTTSRPQAWPHWFTQHGLDPARVQLGTGFEHLYYLLEAAIAGIGVAIAPEPLVADDIASGRLLAPWGFSSTTGQWWLACRRGHSDPRIARLAGWLRRELETPAQA